MSYTHSENKLEKWIKEVTRVVQHVQISLQKNYSGIDSSLLEILTQLGNNLYTLSQQVGRIEIERDNLKALANIGYIVNSSLETDEVLRIVMDTIIKITGAERGFLMLRGVSGELAIHIARNWEQETIGASEFEISSTIINRVVNEGQPILTTNAQQDPRFGGQESIIAYSLRSILCVPLKVKEELTGVIYADNRIKSGIFTDVERDLLAAFANQAAVAIENARLFESVRHTLAEVTELKNLMDNIFASIASGVITTDIQEKITLCNRAAENLLEQNAYDVIGRPLQQILPPISVDLSSYINQVCNENRSVVGLELKSSMPGREQGIWNLSLSPLKNASEVTQGVAIVLEDLTEKKRLEAQRQLFEKMVSPAVISQLDPNQLQLGGRRTEITTLFADIRGFTKFSETVKPEQLVSVLNHYLAAAAEAILEQEGTIDKFMGDAVMAWFNAPIRQPDHTLRAVKAALGIRYAVQKIQDSLPIEAHLSFGVGIHFGEAVLGLVGTEKRIDYTAIGDSVNTAKRIQENASEGQILISAEAYPFVQAFIEAREVNAVFAKGKSQPVAVYEVLDIKQKG